mmetsp:Transcript_40542/g.126799  ORF Transcript_40542/g.126799 Transcript_40542/m.126799 type:complete len:262 (+) Transcript_40542:1521-2306(+)
MRAGPGLRARRRRGRGGVHRDVVCIRHVRLLHPGCKARLRGRRGRGILRRRRAGRIDDGQKAGEIHSVSLGRPERQEGRLAVAAPALSRALEGARSRHDGRTRIRLEDQLRCWPALAAPGRGRLFLSLAIHPHGDLDHVGVDIVHRHPREGATSGDAPGAARGEGARRHALEHSVDDDHLLRLGLAPHDLLHGRDGAPRRLCSIVRGALGLPRPPAHRLVPPLRRRHVPWQAHSRIGLGVRRGLQPLPEPRRGRIRLGPRL